MPANGLAMDARCPLCGEVLLTVARSGRVTTRGLSAVALASVRFAWQGYTLCDDCGRLASIAGTLALN
jgi:hypothetical protein